MHCYHLYHVGNIRKVTPSTRGVEVNTRADFPWFALDFSGERFAADIASNVLSNRGFLTAFYGKCFFDRKGRRFKPNCTDESHDCLIAYAEEGKVFAVLDFFGWPLTCQFKELEPFSLPKNSLMNGTSNQIMPFRKAVSLSHDEVF
jgi:hypothetical protein